MVDKIRSKTGLVIDPYFSATKLKWALDNVDGLRTRAEKGEICFGTIDSWLVFKLTGGKAHITDYSNASRTQLYNIYELAWDDEILDLHNIPPGNASGGKTFPCRYMARQTQKCSSVRIASRSRASLETSRRRCSVRPVMAREAKNTYGTGSFLLMNTGTSAVKSEKLLTTIAWGIGEEPAASTPSKARSSSPARPCNGSVTGFRSSARLPRPRPSRDRSSNDDVYMVPALAGLGRRIGMPMRAGRFSD